MRITSQDETVDVNYDMCTLMVERAYPIGYGITAYPIGVKDNFVLGKFPTETAAKQELTRIWESWDRGCSNHQIRKEESYEL